MVSKASGRSRPLTDAALLRLGRSGWAWEWLRRSADYRASTENGAGQRRAERGSPHLTIVEVKHLPTERWGLCYAEDPDRPFRRAAVFWRPDVDASVCPVSAQRADDAEAPGSFDVRRQKIPTTVLKLPSGEEHLLLCDGVHAIQLHILEGSVLDGPVRFSHVLLDYAKLHDHTLTIERLGAVRGRDRFPAGSFAREAAAARWILSLRALELEAEGRSHAEIAANLYDGSGRGTGFATDWRRSRVRRLLDTGHALAKKGYLQILARPQKTGRNGL